MVQIVETDNPEWKYTQKRMEFCHPSKQDKLNALKIKKECLAKAKDSQKKELELEIAVLEDQLGMKKK